jgi:hypothetical protein
MAERLERRFHSVIAENLADTEGVLRQHGDDLLQRDNLDVFLDARVLPARKMTLIGRAWFAEGFAGRRSTLTTRGWNSGIFVRSMQNDHTASKGTLMMTSCLDRNGGRKSCLQING